MRFTNLLPPAAILAGALCLLAAAHGAVPVPPLWWPEPSEAQSAPPACEVLPHVVDPAIPPAVIRAATPPLRPVCALPLDRIAPAEINAASP